MKRDRATFRGVPFWVETAERTGGRRGVTHEYPGRDVPFHEDLGRNARGFSLDGHVVGPNYLSERNALLIVLEGVSGPGELVHPTYGKLMVAVVGVRVRESKDEGGMARFSIEFTETSAFPSQPTVTPDAGTRVRASSDAVRVAAGVEFVASYAPGVHRTSLADVLRRAVVATDAALLFGAPEIQAAASQRRQVDSLLMRAESVAGAPAALFDSVASLFANVTPTGFRPLLSAYAFATGARPPATTPSRQIERANFDAVVTLVRLLIVVRAAELMPDVAFDSYDSATTARRAVLDLVDDRAESSGAEVYPALTQLRADLVKAVPGEASDLPRLRTVTPAATVPSLVLAYQLFGDVSREADLLARNGVTHPGFVVGGRPLEVLGG